MAAAAASLVAPHRPAVALKIDRKDSISSMTGHAGFYDSPSVAPEVSRGGSGGRRATGVIWKKVGPSLYDVLAALPPRLKCQRRQQQVFSYSPCLFLSLAEGGTTAHASLVSPATMVSVETAREHACAPCKHLLTPAWFFSLYCFLEFTSGSLLLGSVTSLS